MRDIPYFISIFDTIVAIVIAGMLSWSCIMAKPKKGGVEFVRLLMAFYPPASAVLVIAFIWGWVHV